jgi:predicted PhzF superfamily epimerase YddE/YHI9
MALLHVVRVFVGEGGAHGNFLGVFIDGAAVPENRRQAIAADLGYAETVFVDDRSTGTLRIFTPSTELPFAGHPLVGTSWLLTSTGQGVGVLRTRAGDVPTWEEGALTWIRGRAEWSPRFELRQYGEPSEIDALTPDDFGKTELVDAWAWIDEAAGEIRCRVFPHDVGIAEDEATGSAAVCLGAQLARPLTLHQGRGSIIHVRLGPAGTVEVGGAVVLDETRDYEV